MANFKVGDKFRLISGGGEFPLNGAENGEIYTVISDLDHHHGGYTYKTYKFYYNDNENTAYARPEQMELVSQKPTKNQRISALESEVEKLKAELEALKKAQIKAPTQSEQIAKALSAALTKVNESKPKLTPNQKRKAIIAEAKAFVERTLEERASKSYEGGIVVGAFYNVPKFFVNDKKRTVTFIAQSPTMKVVRAKGIAKCAPDDVFNADIGKAIALGRALGLDVSKFEQAVKPTEFAVGQTFEWDTSYDTRIETITEIKRDSAYVKNGGWFWLTRAQQSNYRIIDDTEAQYV